MTISLTKIELTLIAGIVLVLLVTCVLDGYQFVLSMLAICCGAALCVTGELRRRRAREAEQAKKEKVANGKATDS